MSIKDIAEKIKGFRGFSTSALGAIPDDLFLGLIIILVAFGSFGLGRLSKIEGAKTPIRIENAPETVSGAQNGGMQAAAALSSSAKTGQLVGSKSGTKYHYPWCPGAQSITPANLIYFASKTEAEAKGYTPASNCKGL